MKPFIVLWSASVLLLAVQTYAQDQPARHERAVAAIRKLGGEVIVDAEKPGAKVVVVLTGSGSPGQCLPHLKHVINLDTCDL